MSLHIHQDGEAFQAVCLTLNMKERLEMFNTATLFNVTGVVSAAENCVLILQFLRQCG